MELDSRFDGPPKAKSKRVAPKEKKSKLTDSQRREKAKHFAMDFDKEMILRLVDVAMNGKNEASRVKAAEAVYYIAHGRPSTVIADVPTISMVPQFQIFFGDQQVPQQTLIVPNSNLSISPSNK